MMITRTRKRLFALSAAWLLALTTALPSAVVHADPPDTTAPAAITDLAVTDDQTDNSYWKWSVASLRLSWTAPGDDGSTGTATSYDIRYSTSPITDGASWNGATQVVGEPKPAAAGTSQNMIVRRLKASTTYYFAMKTTDKSGNVSAISNVGSRALLGADGFSLSDGSVGLVSGGGTKANLVDGNTATVWGATSYPAEFTYDFGYEWDGRRSINKVRVYESAGTGTLKIYTGRPGGWTLIATDSFSGAAGQKDIEVNILTSRLRFVLESPSGDAQLSEIGFFGRGAPRDETPPSAIDNLAASALSTTSVQLTWTAPGNDNDMFGFADGYDVRYSTSPITDETSWNAATQATGEPNPSEAGSPESMTVSGLTAGLTYHFAIKSNDKRYVTPSSPFYNTSQLSNIVSVALGGGDTTAPAAVANLAATGATPTTITLTWTAPGDDGMTGTATSYDIRYSTSSFTNADWATLTQASGEPVPGAAGTSESFTVTGLSAGTTYYFAIKTKDEVANESGLSNVVSLATTASSDTTPPAAVSNLSVTDDKNDNSYWRWSVASLVLNWTAPGDDGTTGTAASYDIRYSTSPITVGASWNNASQVVAVPVPAAAGTAQSKIVRRLKAGTTYYFAMKTTDHAGNVSSISNIGSRALLSAEGFSVNDGGITIQSGGGTKSRLVDGNTATAWDVSSYPAVFTYDFGYQWDTTRSVHKIRVYESAGTGILKIYTGYPGAWSLLVTDSFSGAAGWKEFEVNILTSCFKFELTSASADARISEIGFLGRGGSRDVTPPDAVANLSATTLSESSVQLSWTAPGNDEEPYGYANSYDIRYSTHPITEGNWVTARLVTGKPTPTEAGTTQSMTVGGLSPGATYYFALKASDIYYYSPTVTTANTSALSNTPTATTLGTPDTTAPGAVTDLNASRPTIVSAKLTWTAPGDDGATGTADMYDIRYSTSPINTGNWASATPVTGEPVPTAAGTKQQMTVYGLTSGTTYYFAMVTLDEMENQSALSNVATIVTLTGTIGAFGKIPLDPSMVLSETARGTPGNLVDEQAAVGDPLNGSPGSAPTTNWFPGGNFLYGMGSAIINLGQDYEINNILVYDKFGGPAGLKFTVYAGSPFEWTKLFDDSLLAPATQWTNHAVNMSSTHYLKVEITDGNLYVPEIIVYGRSQGTNIDVVPSPTPHALPEIDKFMGANAFITNSPTKLQALGNIREYHNWYWDEGDAWPGNPDTSYPGYPNNKNKFNPSWAGGGWNFDGFYQALNTLGINVSPAVQGGVQWLAGGANNKVPPGTDPALPSSYAAHADHMYQFAARYGSTAVADNKLKLAAGQTRSTGLNLIRYYENGNEDDTDWSSRHSFFTPYEFAALSSADYDGDQGRMGTTVGVKNADPNSKLVMAGLYIPELDYIKGMKVWSDYYRNGSFPIDVINIHAYGFGGPDTTGLSPEDAGFKPLLEKFVDYRNRYLPGKEIWLSEFGWDTHPGSNLYAVPVGTFDTYDVQGQWIVRTYLAAAAAGIDRAQMFAFSDNNPNDPTQFANSGLVGIITGDPLTSELPKKSYYYVYTMKNALAGMTYAGEVSSGNPNVLIYKFKSTTDNSGAYAVWSPTHSQNEVNGYQMTLAGTPTNATQITITNGNTNGVSSALTISGGKVTVNVSEKPIFIKVDDIQ
ncbi:fibronectin type III domain-containing protein [Cohnella herbarum]|uniref:Fibronectin type-III domain-containing protein n=1 Tax=Cohnella herbarum TaxID=2728023 RepID=A0A7Z2VFH4_9BACL|nr:fibronectin type III domain-containing protein [Cohnella herbarum]QJD81914.1 hypothetical protein HH215_01095 [Cohnella herbarum]